MNTSGCYGLIKRNDRRERQGMTMQNRKISFSPPDISESEIVEVCDALKSGWITTGTRTKLLEQRLAAYIETGDSDIDLDQYGDNFLNRIVCLNSATAAEEMMLRVLGIGEGDQVIVPAFTYTATAAAAIHVGADVVFIDSQPDSFEMDYDAVERAITSSTKAIIPVDISGIVCDYDRMFDIVERARPKFVSGARTPIGDQIQQSLGRIAIIADCAHAFGAQRKMNGEWKKAGNIADFSFFSFHAVKNLTTAEGGAATWKRIDGVEDKEIYQTFQLMSLHGQNKDALTKTKLGAWEYDIIAPYFKCNMTDIAAAIGLAQLDRYPNLLNRRKEIIERYDKAMDKLGIWHVHHFSDCVKSSGHLYQTRIPHLNEQQRNAVITKMAEKGVACNVHYKPLPMMTAYKNLGWQIEKFPNSYALYENLVTLPLHTLLTDEDVEYVIGCYSDVVGALKH